MNEREEDKKWRESVEARLVSLTSAQKVSDDQMDEMDLEIVDLKETLNGDSKERDGGMIGQVNHIETIVNALNRIMQPDRLKEGGLLNDFRALEQNLETLKRRVEGKEKAREYRWGFLNSAVVAIASIVVAIITTAGLLFTNWDKISAFVKREEKPSQVEQMIEKAKRPKSRHRHSKAKVEPEAANEPPAEMPSLLEDDGNRPR